MYIGDPSWDALVAATLDPVRPELSCDDPINIQYTSGTTGFPKGATPTTTSSTTATSWVS